MRFGSYSSGERERELVGVRAATGWRIVDVVANAGADADRDERWIDEDLPNLREVRALVADYLSLARRARRPQMPPTMPTTQTAEAPRDKAGAPRGAGAVAP